MLYSNYLITHITGMFCTFVFYYARNGHLVSSCTVFYFYARSNHVIVILIMHETSSQHEIGMQAYKKFITVSI